MHSRAATPSLTAVFGLGRSGLSTLRALKAVGEDAIGWDDAAAARAQAEADGYRITHFEPLLEQITRLIVSPGVPVYGPKCPDVIRDLSARQVPIEGDIDVLADALAQGAHHPIIVGITGTNGKSTTTALIAHLCAQTGRSVVLAGNIGMPVLDCNYAEADILVIELSSYQIETLHRLPLDIAVLTNITPDHLDRHGSMENYVAAKQKIFSHVKRSGLAVLGIDGAYEHELAQHLVAEHRLTVETVSVTDQPATLAFDDQALWTNGAKRYDLSALTTLRGRHNAQNIGLAALVGERLGLSPDAIASALAQFPGLAHRLQPIAHQGRVTFVNDSKATNAEAAVHALRAYSHIHWIVGGQPKASGLAGVEDALSNVTRAYLIGEAAAEFSVFLTDHGVNNQIDETLDRAVRAAAAGAEAENTEATVLLSPACASFDQFGNFELRGEAFCALVQEVVNASGAAQ